MPVVLDEVFDAIKEWVSKIWGAIRRAFRRIKDEAIIDDLQDAIRRENMDEAIAAIRLERPVFDEFEREVRNAIRVGGDGIARGMGRIRDQNGRFVAFRFDPRSSAVDEFIRTKSAQKIVDDILEEQRALIREVIKDGVMRGRSERAITLDLVGRINRDTGRREGGVIGLSRQFNEYVASARNELESGDFASYLTRERRDKRFDRIIAKAEKGERKLTQDEIDKIIMRYSDRLLELRGEVIATTEARSALMFGRYRAIKQLVESGKVREDQIVKIWKTVGDERVRHTHVSLANKRSPFSVPFRTSRGARLLFPTDTSLGAPAYEIINCRCWLNFAIDWGGGNTFKAEAVDDAIFQGWQREFEASL